MMKQLLIIQRLSQWNLAEKDFLHSLKIKPNSPQVLNYLAYGWLERDQNIDQAMQMLQKAYQVNPQSYYIFLPKLLGLSNLSGRLIIIIRLNTTAYHLVFGSIQNQSIRVIT